MLLKILLFPRVWLSKGDSCTRYFLPVNQGMCLCCSITAGRHPSTLGRIPPVILLLCLIRLTACSDAVLPALPDLPQIVGTLELNDTVVGVEANKFLYRMHGVVTGARNSIIGYYSHDKKNALFLSSFENHEQAERALKRMSAKIMNTEAGFTPVTAEITDGTVFYKTTGMGLNHLFYRQGTFVVWWQIEPDKAGDILSHARKVHYTIE